MRPFPKACSDSQRNAKRAGPAQELSARHASFSGFSDQPTGIFVLLCHDSLLGFYLLTTASSWAKFPTVFFGQREQDRKNDSTCPPFKKPHGAIHRVIFFLAIPGDNTWQAIAVGQSARCVRS
jgi:hypothetical protein